MKPTLVTTGILRPEVMLRQAQNEIDELKRVVKADGGALLNLRRALDQANVIISCLILQLGGTATVMPEELKRAFRVFPSRDEATGSQSWRVIVEPPPEEPKAL